MVECFLIRRYFWYTWWFLFNWMVLTCYRTVSYFHCMEVKPLSNNLFQRNCTKYILTGTYLDREEKWLHRSGSSYFQFCEVKPKQVRMRKSQEQCSGINPMLSQVTIQLPHMQKTFLPLCETTQHPQRRCSLLAVCDVWALKVLGLKRTFQEVPCVNSKVPIKLLAGLLFLQNDKFLPNEPFSQCFRETWSS